jgi:hypothetical protein
MTALLASAGCGGDDPTTSTAGSASPSPSPSPSPSSACTLVSTALVSSTFDQNAQVEEPQKVEPFQDGKSYECRFRAAPVWTLSVSLRVFTATTPVDRLVSIGVSNNQFATKVNGVGDGAAYINRSSLIQFVAVKKNGDTVNLVLLLGPTGTDDEARFSTIAKEVLANAPKLGS